MASWKIVKHLGEVQSLSSWQETPANVSYIKSNSSAEEPYISTIYSYQVNSKTYEGRKAGVRNRGGFSGFVLASWESEILERKRLGKSINCFYNPDNPNQAVLFRTIVWDYVFLWGCFALVFGMVGVIGLIAVAWAYKTSVYENKLKARHPEEPWKWRKIWETGSIKCNGKLTFLFLWPFAIIWNTLTLPAMIPAYKAFTGGEKFAALALLFPFCGLLLFRWAIQKTLSYKKIGAATLQLKTFPGVTGGLFSATFVTGNSLNLENDICFKLQCFETEPSRGNDDTNNKRLIWADELTIDARTVGNLSHSGIPVEFSIPYSARPTSDELENNIDWSLVVKSELAGSDLDTSFDIPVFQTKDSSPEVTEMNPLPVEKGKTRPVEELIEDSKFRVEGPSGGKTSITVPSVLNRLPGVYFSLLIFSAIFFIGLLAAIHFKIGIFPIFVISIFNLLLGFFVVNFLTTTVIQVSEKSLEITTTLPMYKKVTLYDLNEKSEIRFKHSASGSNGDDYTSYYSITLDKTKTLVGMIDSKQAARWLASTIEEAAGIERQSSAKVSKPDSFDLLQSDQSISGQEIEDRPWVE